jgi:hypothetical protein
LNLGGNRPRMRDVHSGECTGLQRKAQRSRVSTLIPSVVRILVFYRNVPDDWES